MTKNNKTMDAAEKIETILDEFDFHKVERVMHALDWTWASDHHIPTVSELRKCARGLLRDVDKQKENWGCATGGFYATNHGDGVISLRFVVDEVVVDEKGEIL